jgi:hypothetical protein
MEIAVIGGGICGLALAMNLHQRGIGATVYERAPEIRELGVGITVLPHAMREFAALGLADDIVQSGIENAESCFFNRFGQLIYREPRGKRAGYGFPEVGVHRGRLHLILYRAALARLGAERSGSGPVTPASPSNRTRAGRACASSIPTAATPRAGPCRCRHCVRRRQFDDSHTALSRRHSRLRRHQHLARRNATKTDSFGQDLHPDRLDPHRQDGDLSDC